VLESTRSSASCSTCSCEACSGERGSAIRPVLWDSSIPNGEMSFMNESILVGFADLDHVSAPKSSLISVDAEIVILTLPRCNYSSRCPVPSRQTDASNA